MAGRWPKGARAGHRSGGLKTDPSIPDPGGLPDEGWRPPRQPLPWEAPAEGPLPLDGLLQAEEAYPLAPRRARWWTRLAAGVAVIAIGVAAGAAAGFSLAGRSPAGHHTGRRLALGPSPMPSAASTATALQEIAGQDLPEIVIVVAVGAAAEELGTGWPVDSHGDFITNDHVVSQGLTFHVVTSSGAEYPARVVNSDPQLDLAEVQAQGLTEAPLPLDPVPAAMGEPVVVLASQGATGHPPVTVSLVNGLNQRATVNDAEPGQLTSYVDLIRIPAHIFPGNSGGPVLTPQGQVLGIMTLAAKFGVGAFAIPLTEVLPVIRQWAQG